MPDSDRLAELRRQRALIQEHLAWLDREIADAERGPPPSSLADGPANKSVEGAEFKTNKEVLARSGVVTPGSIESVAEAEAQAEALLAEARAGSADLERDVRKGCFLYFAAALALLGATVVGLYFALKR